MTKIKDQQGLALIAVILATLLLGVMGLTLATLVSNQQSTATESLQSRQAFYVADGGLQYILMSELMNDANYSNNSAPTAPPFGAGAINLAPGQFWAEYSNQEPDELDVKVTARVGTAVRAVQMHVHTDGNNLEYAMMAETNITGNNNETGLIDGSIILNGTESIDDDVTITGTINEVSNLEVPTVDFPTYQNLTTSTQTGNLLLNSDYTGDLYVTGNVLIAGNVTYTGILYVGGNVTLVGNNIVFNGTLVAEGTITANNLSGLQFIAQPLSLGVPLPAIAAMGTISLTNSDGMVIRGLVWGDNNINFDASDNLDFRGSFVSEYNLTFSNANNMSVVYDASLVTNLLGLEGGVGSLALSKWRTY